MPPNELFMVAGRAATWMKDIDALRSVLPALEAHGVRGPWFRGCVDTMRASIAGLEGDRETARRLYSDALKTIDELGVKLHAALARIDAALVLGTSDPVGARAAQEARAFFEEVGNRALLDRLATAPA